MRQKCAAVANVLSPHIGQYRCLIPRWSCASRLFKQRFVRCVMRSPKTLPDGTRIGIMAIGGDAIGRHPGHHPRRPKEALGRREVAYSAEPHVHEVAVSINGTVQVTPPPLDFDRRFIRRCQVNSPRRSLDTEVRGRPLTHPLRGHGQVRDLPADLESFHHLLAVLVGGEEVASGAAV
jgi:hypothetical protein